jgi:Mn-dependent DtxR family transcriptional regulator
MLEDEEFSNVSDIAKRMNVTSKYVSLYRKRLIEHGIIGSIGHGKVAFDLPMFREYLQEINQ